MTVAHGLLKRKHLLSERQEALLAELQAVLEQLAAALERFGSDASPADLRAIREAITHLRDLFLLVIAGEFNSGKSSFINALLGATLLPEGATPTTDRITLLRYGDTVQDELREAHLRETTYPADLLRQLIIVDTPGTNAVIRRHEELTRNFIPRADLVLFTTSSDRPFTESERAFLNLIKEWGKKIVLILNKIDILDPNDLEKVLEFIRNNARDVLGTTPEIFAVSARWALRSRDNPDADALWAASRIGTVEKYIVETLDEETRVKLKLLTPVGVGQRVVDTYLAAVGSRLATLRDDFTTLDTIEQQLSLFRQDLANDGQYHLNEIDTILRDLEDRGMRFFDETIRIQRLPDLINSEKTRALFEQEVIGDVARQLEQRVQAMIDWMIEKDLRLWQSIVDYVSRRRAAQHEEQIIGQVGGAFDYNRGKLLESVGQTANRVIASYDEKVESQALADEVRASLAATAITQAGAVGLGALLLTIFHTVWLDVTGILAATLIAVGGFYLLPAKRRQARKAFQERIDTLRTQLRQTLQRQFEREVDQSLGRIREAVAPYTRFVRSRREQLTDLQQSLAEVDVTLRRLRAEIEA